MSKSLFDEIQMHPIKKKDAKIRELYAYSLTYIVERTLKEKGCYKSDIEICVNERMRLYQDQVIDIPKKKISEKVKRNISDALGIASLSALARSKNTKYLCMIACDISLILVEEFLVLHALNILSKYLSTKQKAAINSLSRDRNRVVEKLLSFDPIINQSISNSKFFSQKMKKIIVTASVSAGKSTLINALIGKHIARTSQEICTGNICYIYNKDYEDNNIHISDKTINLSESTTDLRKLYNWDGPVSIITYFAGINTNVPRLCMIDTPGVDAALYKEHSECTYNELQKNDYDKIIYVVSPTQLGADSQISHLKWVSKNLQKEKVIFVLNKIDDYSKSSDSIEESIRTFRNELVALGFSNPVICPISAYFSYLLKLKMTGQTLSEDEEDDYYLYAKKFMRPYYNLTRYYKGVKCLHKDTKEVMLSKLVGLYGLEKILYGGRL